MTAPLNTHIQNQLIEMVQDKLLLERITLNGVDVDVRDNEGRNALYWAITRRSTHNANLLISFGSNLMVDENKHALFHAIECGHHNIVVLLAQKDLDINIRDNIGKTALMCAVEEGSFEIVKFIVEQGADLYLMDDELRIAEDYVKLCDSELIQSYFKHLIYTDMNEDTCHTPTSKCSA